MGLPMSFWTPSVARWSMAGAACFAAVALAAQELPRILETVEVRVVNVDVVVTDAAGRPVRGLERGDFELTVSGRPMEMTYFSSVVEGSRSEADAIGDRSTLPYLAIVHDGRGSRPAEMRRTIETIWDQLDTLLANTRAVMVLRQDTALIVEQPMTRDRSLLGAALERLATRRAPPLDVSGRELLVMQLEGRLQPQALGGAEAELIADSEDDVAIQQADNILRQIRQQAEMERRATAESGQQLRLLARSMAGLNGRKAILLLGQGLRRQPAQALYRLWWSKFERYAPRIGVLSIDAEMSQVRTDQLLSQLIDDANAHRVTFYTFDPAGLSAVGGSAAYRSLETSLEMTSETEGMRDSLVDLSLSTGGVAQVRTNDVGLLLDEMLSGFGSYYSLGFTPEGIEHGRVRVRVRHPDLRVRYLRRFSARTAAQQLEEATLAALLTGAEDNRLQVRVDLGDAEPQEDGTFLVPLLIKVPLARISLLPQRTQHVGRLSFVVMAQSADGGLSPPATGVVPIEVANSELLSAMGQVAGYRMRLRTGGGQQILAIGVRDEVAQQDATIQLSLEPDRGL